jgi:hypothetical protein
MSSMFPPFLSNASALYVHAFLLVGVLEGNEYTFIFCSFSKAF